MTYNLYRSKLTEAPALTYDYQIVKTTLLAIANANGGSVNLSDIEVEYAGDMYLLLRIYYKEKSYRVI